MNSLQLAFSVVFPLLIMLATGYFLKKIKVFNDRFVSELNGLCFKVFLPLTLFINVYKSDFSKVFMPQLVVFGLVCVAISFIVLMIVIPYIEKQPTKRGVLVQGIMRSNFVLFGIPIVTSLFGERYLGATSILIAFVVPAYNIFSVIALESFNHEKINVRKILKGVATNPLIIGSMLGVLLVLTGIKMPTVLENVVFDMSKVAMPLALVGLGGSFSFSAIGNKLKPMLIGVVGKLILLPIAFLTAGILFGFRDFQLGILLAMAASPTAVSSYTMAESMNQDSELAGQIVVIGSAASIFTIFIWIMVLKQFQFI